MVRARVLPLIAAAVITGCAGGREPPAPPPQVAEHDATADWARAAPVDVALSEFHIDPAHIVLAQGRPYRLHVENQGSLAHNLDAPQFLASAALRADTTGAAVRAAGGRVDVPAGEARDLYLVPLRSGTFPVECSRPLHATLGMSGDVVVQPPP